ncbi:unnamed protein product [Adineta steineri]|uniref:Uncharacterized protein n=1 Tax=Adineta steineri TaxID=433720 RepID=A0A815RDD7_9BILA|nr:unnamed protein product [Adineta steineri]
MEKNYILIVVIYTIALFSTVYGATANQCNNITNPTCQTCLNAGSCAYCKTTKTCFLYNSGDILSSGCNTVDMQWQTCVGNFRVWIIIVSVIGGVLLIAILITLWCFCRKCKRCRIRKEERRQEIDEQRMGARMEERRAAAEVRSTERNRVADQIRMKYGILKANENNTDYAQMIFPSFHLVIKQCHNQWRSLLFRRISIINQRQLSTTNDYRKDSKQQGNNILVQSQNNQIDITAFTHKAQQAVKDCVYSLVIVAGVVALGGVCYLILHELYSRETPNGIYKEASKLCLANINVQEALGTPILVHTTPQIGSLRINNVR